MHVGNLFSHREFLLVVRRVFLTFFRSTNMLDCVNIFDFLDTLVCSNSSLVTFFISRNPGFMLRKSIEFWKPLSLQKDDVMIKILCRKSGLVSKSNAFFGARTQVFKKRLGTNNVTNPQWSYLYGRVGRNSDILLNLIVGYC